MEVDSSSLCPDAARRLAVVATDAVNAVAKAAAAYSLEGDCDSGISFGGWVPDGISQ